MGWLFGGLGFLLGRGAAMGGGALTGGSLVVTEGLIWLFMYFMIAGSYQSYIEECIIARNKVQAGNGWDYVVCTLALPYWRISNPNIKSIGRDVTETYFDYTPLSATPNHNLSTYTIGRFRLVVTYKDGTHEKCTVFIHLPRYPGKPAEWAEMWRTNTLYMPHGIYEMKPADGDYDQCNYRNYDRMIAGIEN